MEQNNPLQAQIIRDKTTKKASLKINFLGEWKLYVGDSINNINTDKPILEGQTKGIYPLHISLSSRAYFKLISRNSSIILSETHIPLEGAYNFRDLGGLKAQNGRQIKWGKLFRADDLSKLTPSDLTYLQSIPIISIIDFRARNEARRYPDKYPSSVRFSYPMAITPGNLSQENIEKSLHENNMAHHMEKMNEVLVTNKECLRTYRHFFNILQNSLSAPIVFHCSAGKDRTGIATFLLLYALGVDMDIIIKDYLSSRLYLKNKYSNIISKYPKAEPLFTVKESYLNAAIKEIINQHGSIDSFLSNTLNVDIERLRFLYLGKENNN